MAGVMSFPTRIVHGRGSAQKLPAELKRAGALQRVFIITDPGILKANLLRFVAPPLEQSGLRVSVWQEVQPTPDESNAHAGANAFKQSGADTIVAIGGGGVLAAAKAIRLLATQDPPLSRFAEGGDAQVAGALAPMAAVPTSSGAGSEASGEAVLVIDGSSVTLSSPRLLPDVAILDAELTAALPPLLTAISGMNALAHALEAWLARSDHPLADALALESLRRIGRSLRTAVKSGRDLDAREQLMMGACLAGIAAQKGKGAVRAIAHALSPVTGTPQGLACAAMLPGVLAFNRLAAEEKLGQAAVALGFDPRAPAGEASAACATMVDELRTACGLPRKLSQAGVKREQLAVLVEKATESPAHAQSPRACTEVDFERLLGEAF
jgi:4-hydroxybutyrate dehydrogenase